MTQPFSDDLDDDGMAARVAFVGLVTEPVLTEYAAVWLPGRDVGRVSDVAAGVTDTGVLDWLMITGARVTGYADAEVAAAATEPCGLVTDIPLPTAVLPLTVAMVQVCSFSHDSYSMRNSG